MQENSNIPLFDNMLVYKKDYTANFVKTTIRENNLDGLRIFDHLEELESLDFLRDFAFLKKIEIDSILDHDYSFLEKLTNLRTLKIGASIQEKNIIDLSYQINVANLTINWRRSKIKGLAKCQKITSLCLVEYKEGDFTPISSLGNLESLQVKTGSVNNVDGVENFRKLRHLLLGNCKKLESISNLSELEKLTSLHIEQCPKIKDYGPIGSLLNLENLQIVDCKGVNTIGFIKELFSLKKLSLLGNTDVLDGDLKPAQSVKEVFYKHREHYNVKIQNEEYDRLVKRNFEKLKEMSK